MDDSHVKKKTRRNDFNRKFKNGKALFRSFSGGSMNGVGYILNDVVTTEYLWKDGIHL